MTPLTERIITIVKAIPSGETLSYGEVAKRAGSPKGARQVVRILHIYGSKENLPWWRVLNRDKKISLPFSQGGEEQRVLLLSEGVEVNFK